MTNNLDIFRKEFLAATTWAQRKDGVPLYLLDRLSAGELKIAEAELIRLLSLNDTWPIIGLGHIQSTQALPALYNLLGKSSGAYKVTIAYAIFQVCSDQQMADIVLAALPDITSFSDLISVLYMLPGFQEERITAVLQDYRNHKAYLVAYNATRALGLATDDIVKKFRQEHTRGC